MKVLIYLKNVFEKNEDEDNMFIRWNCRQCDINLWESKNTGRFFLHAQHNHPPMIQSIDYIDLTVNTTDGASNDDFSGFDDDTVIVSNTDQDEPDLNDVDEPISTRTCRVCDNNYATYAFAPCGHLCTCPSCHAEVVRRFWRENQLQPGFQPRCIICSRPVTLTT